MVRKISCEFFYSGKIAEVVTYSSPFYLSRKIKAHVFLHFPRFQSDTRNSYLRPVGSANSESIAESCGRTLFPRVVPLQFRMSRQLIQY